MRLPHRLLVPLVEASTTEGFVFLHRLLREWADGTNRYAKRGELLLLALEGRAAVGICGLNQDPFLEDPAVSRLRHLYVLPSHRRRGVGRTIVTRCIEHARPFFRRLRLRTETDEAARFYRSLGFVETAENRATHTIDLCGDPECAPAPGV